MEFNPRKTEKSSLSAEDALSLLQVRELSWLYIRSQITLDTASPS